VHDVTVSRGIDLLFVAYWKLIDVPIPVCGPCKRHRRIAGVLGWTGTPLAILVGGFLAMTLVMSEHTTAAAVLAVVIGGGALAGRFWLDELLEWRTLGVRLVWKKGNGIPLRVTFRRPEYFAAWAAANPAATLDAGAPVPQPKDPIVDSSEPTPPHRYEERTMTNEQLSDRKIPVLMLLGLTVCLLVHHWYAVTQHEVFFAALFLLPAFWMLALGGSFHPPILYSIGKYGKDLPTSTKVVGALFAISGVGLGFCLAKYVYGMF
jgi:hypothetical protein